MNDFITRNIVKIPIDLFFELVSKKIIDEYDNVAHYGTEELCNVSFTVQEKQRTIREAYPFTHIWVIGNGKTCYSNTEFFRKMMYLKWDEDKQAWIRER